jgi:thioredoxin-like negative regulator of GroEL
MTTSPQAGHWIQLTDAEFARFLSATRGAVMIEVTMENCPPCRFMRPVVRKLAAEFADRLVAAEIGEEAVDFCGVHQIDAFPQLLFFRDGRYVERMSGFEDADTVREAVVRFLGLDANAEASPDWCAFRAACARGQARFREIMRPALDALDLVMAAAKPQVDAMERAIETDLAAGRLRQEDVVERRQADCTRVYAPFEADFEALKRAAADAFAVYDAITADAHSAGNAPKAGSDADAAGANCKPGQPFCSR